LHPPYSIQKNEDGTYFFITNSEIKYSIVFIVRDDLNNVHGTNVYEFSFGPEGIEFSDLPGHDNRIYPTILKVIEDFFIKETNALLFVCESSDTKGLVRERLFERWYRIAPCPYIDKFDETVQDSELGIEYITSLLVHTKAPYKNLLLKEYKNLSLFYSK
jgi:hypothetical protein